MSFAFASKAEAAGEETLPQVEPGAGMRLIVGLLKPYGGWLGLIFLSMVVETTMSLATPWPLKVIIDSVIGNEPLPGWLTWLHLTGLPDNKAAMAIVTSFSIVAFAGIGAFAGYINNYYTESVAQYVANDLRQRMYHHLQRLSLSYYDSHQIAKILNTITADVSTIQDFASESLLRMLVDALTIVGMLGIMVYLHLDFALIAVGVTPFLLLFVARFKREVKKATREVRKDQSIMAAVMQQGLESMRSVNAFGRQDLEEERLRKASLETVAAALKARRLKALLSPVVAVIVSCCVAMVLWRGSTLVMGGFMTIGALTVFLAYLGKFFSPVQDLAKLTNTIAQAGVALERIETILHADNIIPEKVTAIVPGKLRGDISFEHVYFAYATHNEVLHDFNLHIRSGQRIGICGPTGGGKSTVASLIARFYDPVKGVVRIDGVNVADYSIEGLRRQIGFVLQDTFIFYGTVRENIAYGRPDASDAEIIEAARMARAHDFIIRMPEGYNSMLGERGITLSGGQRQCIGIARAIIRNAPILILDEPTAALDAESEKIVIEALEHLMKGRTVIIIAHRLSTIRDADKIVVLKNGVVAEEGTHEELLAQCHIYHELYHLQMGSEPLYTPETEPVVVAKPDLQT